MRARTLSLLLVILCLATVMPARSSVLISELCDPRLNYTTDRFIEIYNSGDEAVDLVDWSLVAVGNGGDIFPWHLSGLIEPGDALVAGDATTTVAFPVDFPEEEWSNNNGLWN
ncbi:lamin tail domain-containing protein, partial [Candidatus Bipolaricaulota bacterium]|nr:lamin tail domain-containing protein [Candidatus Bipolaricaulota bacterium]